MRGELFSAEKIKNGDTAVYFYKGFPNFNTLMDVFSYLLPELEHINYWEGSDTPVNIYKNSEKSRSSSKPGPKGKLSLLEELFQF